MASVKENLIAAKALIDTPEKWIKGTSTNETRTCFCAMGAVSHVTKPHRIGFWTGDTPEYAALSAEVPKERALPVFNDLPDTTHADIMALFDRAIAAQDAAP